jgi:hypothetical protein
LVQSDGTAETGNGLVNRTKSRKTCATLKLVVMIVETNREQMVKESVHRFRRFEERAPLSMKGIKHFTHGSVGVLVGSRWPPPIDLSRVLQASQPTTSGKNNGIDA